MHLKIIFYFCSFTLFLTGCASNPPLVLTPEEPAETTEQKSPTVPEEKIDPPTRPFEGDTLYSLLVAEFAGQRQRFDILLSNYMSQAENTRDPGVAERATRIATYLQANQAALVAAKLWEDIAPDNSNAKQAYSVQLVKADRFHDALTQMEETTALGADAAYDYLALNSRKASHADREELLARYDKLLETDPQNGKLLFGKTILLQLNNELDAALETANLLDSHRSTEQSTLLVARLLHQMGQTDDAIERLENELETKPENKQYRLLYAQLLIDQKHYEKAYQEFDTLVEFSPQDGQMRLTLALLAMENNLDEAASEHLSLLVNNEKLQYEAHYYLAQLAERQEDTETMLEHYRQVTSGDKALKAHSKIGETLITANRLSDMHEIFSGSRETNTDLAKSLYLLEAELLSRNQYTQAAEILLNKALTEFPEDINLLYSRAMAAVQTNDLKAMERDLRSILGKDPDNAMVLNTLGYTLVDRTDRHDEALVLIKRANELKPNDPAITDSLGWAMYRIGEYEEAIRLLEKAFADFPDHEVAAHLGEVYWITGKQQQAQQLWKDALKERPDSDILRDVIDRLDPTLAP